MTLTLQQWKEVLDAINSSDVDILKQIKEKLREKHEDEYQEWGEKGFDVNHLFSVQLTVGEKLQDIKLALLLIAASNGHLNIVKYLVDDKKVSLDQRICGVVALYWAASNGHLDIVKYLVDDKKVSLDQRDGYGNNALHMAARNGHLDIVKYLMDDKNVSLDQRHSDGNTALHMAAFKGHKDVVTTILEKGANPLIKNKNGKIPRELAKDKNIIQFLKEAEAKTKQIIIRKAIKIGVIGGIITALTVGIGYGVTGVELSLLAIAGIALAATLLTGGITYSVSVLWLSNMLDTPTLALANRQVGAEVC